MIAATLFSIHILSLTGANDGWRIVLVLDGSIAGSCSLNSFHNVHRLAVGNFAKDDMLAVEPGGDDGGDEEL